MPRGAPGMAVAPDASGAMRGRVRGRTHGAARHSWLLAAGRARSDHSRCAGPARLRSLTRRHRHEHFTAAPPHPGSSKELGPAQGVCPQPSCLGARSRPAPEVAALWAAPHAHTQDRHACGRSSRRPAYPLAQRAPGSPCGSSPAARARCASPPTTRGVCLGVGEGPDGGLEIRPHWRCSPSPAQG